MNTEILDILIVGAGPIGIACGIEAKKANLSHLIVEKGVLANSVYHFPTHMTFFSTSELLEIGNIPFLSHYAKPTRQEALEYFRRVIQHFDLNINLQEKVEEVNKNFGGLFKVTTSKTTYYAHNVVFATGFFDQPRLLNIKGEQLPKVKHYYDDPHLYINQKVLIVGAGNSACGIALELYRKGIDVTMAVRKPHIKPTVKYWIKPDLENRIKSGEIKAYFGTTVQEIKVDTVLLKTAQGLVEIENDAVLAMTGYKPNFELLQKAGIWLLSNGHKTPSHNPKTLETNVEGLYVAGVISAGLETNRLFIENTRVHASQIVSNILEKKATI
ncbi:MAG: YpdA family putative bacillithiol disulfide reductase [Aureispira sp.]|nr:YpdA family putative bacillithiol disulfide reductase [Aureispira sp.]